MMEIQVQVTVTCDSHPRFCGKQFIYTVENPTKITDDLYDFAADEAQANGWMCSNTPVVTDLCPIHHTHERTPPNADH